LARVSTCSFISTSSKSKAPSRGPRSTPEQRKKKNDRQWNADQPK
jgi:hypothetical protein